jgi:peptidylprolyl isomerase
MTSFTWRTVCAATLFAALLGGAGPGFAQDSKPPPPKNASQAPPIPLHGLDPLAPSPKEPPLVYAESDWRTPDPDNLLVIDTNKGRIIVELAPEIAPESVARVKALARQHFYDGQEFFRVIEDFMAQTGDPKNQGDGGSSLPDVKGEFSFRRDHNTRFVPEGQPSDGVQGFIGVMPIEGQPDLIMAMTADGKANAWPLFCAGVAGMARSASPDSANSQFFLMRDTSASLNKHYAGFGRVIVGEDVVKALKAGEPVPAPADRMTRVRLATDLPPGEHLSVRVLDPASPGFAALVERTRTDQVGEFSICDIAFPAQVK